ncbi:MAG: plasmid pRiA4b ORF-3 family protein [Desulfobacterales bacterium]|nr:plasmid pRiA4b ORF-3 family protein [Desulfobacterales bacterium]
MKSYCFKVALMYDKRTYRHIELLEKNTFHAFHKIIFDAFDRYDEHMYSFFLTGKATKSIRAIYDAPEITHAMMLEEDFFLGDKKKYNTEDTGIGEVDLAEKDKLYYLFDFGDDWWHEITLLKIGEAEKSATYPRIVKKVGESPEQYPDYDDEDFEE